MEIITSRTNPLCTHLRKLASSVSYRRDCGGLRQPQVAGGGFAARVVCTDPAALPALPEDRPPRPGTRGFDEIHLSRTDAPGRPLRVRPAGPDASGTVDGPGRGSGSGECGDDPPADAFHADGLFLVNACADRTQSRSGLHGCGVPLPGVDLRAGRAAGAAARKERPALVWRGPSERYGADVRRADFSTAPWPLAARGRASRDALAACDLRDPDERSLRVPERCCCGGRRRCGRRETTEEGSPCPR